MTTTVADASPPGVLYLQDIVNKCAVAEQFGEEDETLPTLPADAVLIVDFGSWQCRAGWSHRATPSMVFDSTVHRWRDEEGRTVVKIGRGVPTGASVRATTRTAFEGPLLVHVPTAEHIFDFALETLVVEGERKVSVLMTEPPLNPPHCRREMAELLFEGYSCVDRVAFVLDGPLAPLSLVDGVREEVVAAPVKRTKTVAMATETMSLANLYRVVVHIGASCTHVYPVIAGAIDWNQVRRINWGGAVASEFLHRLLGLKYPALMTATNPHRLTPLHAQWLLHHSAVVVEGGMGDYSRAMTALEEDSGLERMDQTIQLAGTAATEATRRRAAAESQKLAERAAAALREKRRLLADRLRAQNAEQRIETLRSKEHIVVTLRGLVEAVHVALARVQGRASEPEQDDEGTSVAVFSDADEPAGDMLAAPQDDGRTSLSLATLGDARLVGELGRFGYRRLGALETGLREAEEDLLRFQATCSAHGISIDPTIMAGGGAGNNAPVDAPDYALLDMADSSLTEEQVREKRRLRLLKNSADARERMRQERLVAAETEAAAAAALETLRIRDLDGWRDTLYGRRTTLLTRILARQKRRSDRRGQQDARLRSVVALGVDHADDVPPAGNIPDAGPDDGFGMNDDDWLVYRGLSRENDDERDAQDQAALVAVEELLETRDSDEFFRRLQAEQDAGRTLIDRLLNGPGTAAADEENGAGGEASSPAIHLNAERMRCTEGLFQPGAVMGIDQAGLAEVLQHLFSAYLDDIQARLARAVVLSGGSAALPGLSTRLAAELRAMLPTAVSEITVSVAAETTAVWRGARELCLRHPAAIPWISREQYEASGAVAEGSVPPSAFSNPY